jgi:hypothetical protein
MTTTPQTLKSLCVPMLQRKNWVHANVCGMLSPHSTAVRGSYVIPNKQLNLKNHIREA